MAASLCAAFSMSCSIGSQSSSFRGTSLQSKSMVSIAPRAQPVTLMKIRRWETLKIDKKTNKPVRQKMHVKTGDTVVVISGDDKGKVTEVLKVDTKRGKILCNDVNVRTKHNKATEEGGKGFVEQKEFPIQHSNVMHYSKKEKVRSRVKSEVREGKKVRVLVKTGEVIPEPVPYGGQKKKSSDDSDSA